MFKKFGKVYVKILITVFLRRGKTEIREVIGIILFVMICWIFL